MKKIVRGMFAAVSLAFCANAASATVLTFDDAFHTLGDLGNPADFYSSDGVAVGGEYLGVIGGNGNGNPGGWGLEGTDGSAFLGCNDGNSCSPTFGFANPVQDVSLDLGLANAWSATFTVSGYLNGVLIDSVTSTLSDSGKAGGTWETFSLAGPVNSVVVTERFTQPGFAFGLDNVRFSAAVPEPASWAMLLIGFGTLGALQRRRRAVAFRAA